VRIEPKETRRLHLEGVVNFRDLGGYRTSDGRRIRWQRIFRSDMLAELTRDDLERLCPIGIKTVCDLRSAGERAARPSPMITQPPPTMHQIGFMPHEGEQLLADVKAGRVTVAQIEMRVGEIYRRFVIDQAATYSSLLELAVTQSLPMLVHCTSGRDRTGFAAAVILMALGCDRSTIAADYLLSNRYRRDLTFQIGGSVENAVMAALTSASPAYLNAAFAAIDALWGSDQNYLASALGFSPARQSLLRDRLLEEMPT
jgi:protein-tyrosine phosphatase